jgi:hypothetical protein
MRFSRRPAFETFSPARKDSRIGEARAFLKDVRHLRNLTVNGLRCQFNLKPETAAALLAEEQARREGE